jgi:hypothetical protein
METVCFGMAEYVSRTATTPILNQSNERNATVLDASGRLAALSVGIPQFMLTSTLPVRFALDRATRTARALRTLVVQHRAQSRQGRAEEHIALFYPDTDEERLAMLRAMHSLLRSQLLKEEHDRSRQLTVAVPDLGTDVRNRQLEAIVKEFADKVARLLRES